MLSAHFCKIYCVGAKSVNAYLTNVDENPKRLTTYIGVGNAEHQFYLFSLIDFALCAIPAARLCFFFFYSQNLLSHIYFHPEKVRFLQMNRLCMYA